MKTLEELIKIYEACLKPNNRYCDGCPLKDGRDCFVHRKEYTLEFLRGLQTATVDEQEKPLFDSVEHPSHYTQGEIECIQAIKASLSRDGFSAYCKGNCEKYLWRYEHKNRVEDLKKARVYLDWLIENEESV